MEKEAVLYEPIEGGKVHCFLCNHHCRIADAEFGFCRVRQNIGGKLYTHAYGRVIAANVDPIEKKPLYHFLPGTLSFSVATMGCNFRCEFCQNWQISQIPEKNRFDLPGRNLSPAEIVEEASDHECRSISYTYTEPTIFFEYAYDTARQAKKKGLCNVFVTNGYMTHQALDMIRPYLDACNVDLKSFSGQFYKKTCRGRLEPVLDTIRHIKKSGIWIEITTLVIPGQNDDESQVRAIAQFIAGIDTEIPWHISRFHPDYEFTHATATPAETLEKAYFIGKSEGLHYVYIGNMPSETMDTRCSRCGQTLIRRRGSHIQTNNMKNAVCPFCGEHIAGVFA